MARGLLHFVTTPPAAAGQARPHRVMPGQRAHRYAKGLLLMAGLIPTLGQANPAGVAAGLVTLYTYVLGWFLLAVLVLIVASKLWGLGKGLVTALLFLPLPIVLWTAYGIWDRITLFAASGSWTPTINPTPRPLSLGRVEFPAGSRAEYAKDSDGHWSIVDLESPQPVRLGSLEITQLSLDRMGPRTQDGARFWVTLSRPQAIEGWHCQYKAATLRFVQGDLALDNCRLEETHFGALTWAEGTDLDRTPDGSWRLHWSKQDWSMPCQGGMKAFGFNFTDLYVEYGRHQEVLNWRGATCEPFVRGGYRFSGHVEQLPDHTLRLEGQGKDPHGREFYCLEIKGPNAAPKPCAEDPRAS